VGIIARRYCGSLVITEKRTLRRTASAEAAKLLGSIVRQGTAKLSKALWKASKGKVDSVFSGMREYAKEVGSSLLAKAGLQKSKRVLEEEIETVTSKTIDRSGSGTEEGEPE
jgi:glutamyl-tRNA reductase